MLKLGSTAKRIRESKGLSELDVALLFGLGSADIHDIETNQWFPPPNIMELYHRHFGVDIYMLAWCLHGDVEKLPEAVRASAKALADSWKEQLGEIAKS